MKGTVKSGKGRFLVTLLLVLLLIAAVLTISVTIGAVNVSAGDIGKILVNKISGKDIFRIAWEGKTENIIWNIRFPRVLMAFIVGAGLALCGVLMQALTKNPLADPYVLGISSGRFRRSSLCHPAWLVQLHGRIFGYLWIYGGSGCLHLSVSQHCIDPWSDYLDAAGSGGYRDFRPVLGLYQSDGIRNQYGIG